MGETLRRLRNGFVIGLGFLGAVLLVPLVGAAALSTLNTGNVETDKTRKALERLD